MPSTLSPSRAADFMRCPLQYRFRAIDRLPEQPSAAAARGTLVHRVLEALFQLDPAERTLGAALDLVAPQFAALMKRDPELSSLFESADLTPEAFTGGARDLVESYFSLEDPQLVQPVASELLIEAPLADGPLLRGYVDRLDPADSTGNLKIVDYKTGRS
ncbi:MAG: PD-(D/E)XK nuclease family protein, partial [Bifidobacteriaceae bacterium]|nr:PD-(D/E)XK nuclease family protein [Bifidobacteriaceae bacterium]